MGWDELTELKPANHYDDNIITAINRLQASPNLQNLKAFLSDVSGRLEHDPELQFIRAKAQVVLGTAEANTWWFLLNYFEGRGQIYPALCCAEARLIREARPEFIDKHASLISAYDRNKELEISRIKEAFAKNPPVHTVSVIMATHDRHQYIGRSIESVLNQTFQDFELIVVNDGGSRECESIIDSFHSGKIKYIKVEHGGKSRALNRGILESQSKYIAYLDDDDRYYPEHLETLVTVLEESGCPFAYANSSWIISRIQDGKCLLESRNVNKSHDFDPGLLSEANYIPLLCMAHRRHCFERIGLFEVDLSNMEDWDLWVKASKLYDFVHIDKVTSEYELRFGADSLTGMQLNHKFFYIILHRHNEYLAKQLFLELGQEVERGRVSCKDLEKKLSRYTNNKYLISKIVLPFSLRSKDWAQAGELLRQTLAWFIFYEVLPRFQYSRPFKLLRSGKRRLLGSNAYIYER